MKRSAFGNLSGFGGTSDQHAAMYRDFVEGANRLILDVAQARERNSNCGNTLRMLLAANQRRTQADLELMYAKDAATEADREMYAEMAAKYLAEMNATLRACAKKRPNKE